MSKLIKKFQNPDDEIKNKGYLDEVVVTGKKPQKIIYSRPITPAASYQQINYPLYTPTFVDYTQPQVPVMELSIPELKSKDVSTMMYKPTQLTAAKLLGQQEDDTSTLLAMIAQKISDLQKNKKSNATH